VQVLFAEELCGSQQEGSIQLTAVHRDCRRNAFSPAG
jgi:hypothetical protein